MTIRDRTLHLVQHSANNNSTKKENKEEEAVKEQWKFPRAKATECRSKLRYPGC